MFTSNAHGLANGDIVWLANVSGTGNWATGLNGRWYTVASAATNTFQLRNSVGNIVSTSGYSGSYPGSGTVTRCLEAACQVRVTSNNHGFANNDWVWVQGVSELQRNERFVGVANDLDLQRHEEPRHHRLHGRVSHR
ncbi:hypothetical protein [Candidatus Viadribacter manganicus]|uniref:hypothetical protein n=1 Tax=Candidatus Viadribacter manganicus TaxID=1759059 RepID=UPI0012EA7799|nr:hypothetical protein [Candidatus Viadribacter manganicus]